MGSKGPAARKDPNRTVDASRSPLVDANSGMLSLSSDGSVDWPRTLRLAEFACRDHVTRAIVTAPYSCIDVLHARLPHLTGLLSQHQLPIEIAPAIEFSLSEDLFDRVVHTSLVFGGPVRRYVFLRIPSDCRLPVLPVIESLRRMNLTPILLAPERVLRYQEDASELHCIVSRGGIIQLSAASMLDQTDMRRVRFCRHLIRKNLCHVVASESGRHHDMPISLQDAYQVAARWAGGAIADAICRRNPSCTFDGEQIDSAPAKRGVSRLFSRAA